MAAETRRDSTESEFNPFRDLTRTFEQFKLPGADMNSFVDARRKDVEALVAANKIAYEALQGLARTQADMLTQTMQGMQESSRGVLGGDKGIDLTKQAEAMQKAWQKMLTDMKKLAEMAQKAQTEALAGLTERAKENFVAIKGQTHPK